jgi:3-dehydroquinate dehydratase
MKILMLHGINHDMFGKRDPAQYGTITLEEINAGLQKLGKELVLKWNASKPTMKVPCASASTKVSWMVWMPS